VNNTQPLVSIISFCKDRIQTIRRSAESVLGQSYRNLEFVVQDGASTDGTVEGNDEGFELGKLLGSLEGTKDGRVVGNKEGMEVGLGTEK
jgi:hypothetical protein